MGSLAGGLDTESRTLSILASLKCDFWRGGHGLDQNQTWAWLKNPLFLSSCAVFLKAGIYWARCYHKPRCIAQSLNAQNQRVRREIQGDLFSQVYAVCQWQDQAQKQNILCSFSIDQVILTVLGNLQEKKLPRI